MLIGQNRWRQNEWRKWFAWYPVYIKELDCDVWLETVECSYYIATAGGESCCNYYYRLPSRSIA